MFSLSNDVSYFSNDSTENLSYMEEYEKLKSMLNLKNDLYFFDPIKYSFCKDKVMEMNQFTLADYMDLTDIDIESGCLDRVNKDLTNYTEQFDKINDDILSKQLGNVVFKPAMEIDELIKSFKEILLDNNIDKIFISSGSIHAMRYSLVFETFSQDELEAVKKHLAKTDITIIYGPFALLDEDGHNKFIKLLFELEGNVFSLKIDKDTNNYRNHFIYTHSNIERDKYHSIIFETAHREYLTRRNLIEIKSKKIIYMILFLVLF